MTWYRRPDSRQVNGGDGDHCSPPWLQCGCNRRLPAAGGGQLQCMSGESDQAKGRIKQAVGDLTDDKDMKREGKVDEVAGKAKEGVDKVKDKLTGKDD
jgi:uncharacterized protein YjbJ (UPF0337 family)